MPLLDITPKDSLLFRDGKPFTAGQSHSAESIFPPKPSVFAGFIRSKIFVDNWQGDPEKTWKKVEEEIGNKNESYGKLNIKAILIKGPDEKYYLPTPLDIVKEKEKGNNSNTSLGFLTPKKLGFSYKTDIAIDNLPFAPKEIKFSENAGGFISWDAFCKYLSNEKIEKTEIKGRDFFVESEPRVGIKVGKSNTAEEGYLYSVEFLRFKNKSGFIVYYDGINFPEKGDYFIGGEKRQVYFEKKQDNNISLPDITDKINKYFKVVLLTPLKIENNEIEPEALKVKLNGIAKFVSAAIRTELIGGWDIENNKPKPIERYYSAGSVFYYELTDSSKKNELKNLNFETLASKEGQLGFGRIVIGLVKEEN